MTTFSVAPQSVTSLTGVRIEFSVDPADYARCICRVSDIGTADKPAEHPGDYVEVIFARNGTVINTRVVDAEAEADAVERAAAQRRLAAAPAVVTDEDRKKADAEKAKQIEADKALLASEPKPSKFKDLEPKPEPAPAAAPPPAAAAAPVAPPAGV